MSKSFSKLSGWKKIIKFQEVQKRFWERTNKFVAIAPTIVSQHDVAVAKKPALVLKIIIEKPLIPPNRLLPKMWVDMIAKDCYMTICLLVFMNVERTVNAMQKSARKEFHKKVSRNKWKSGEQ